MQYKSLTFKAQHKAETDDEGILEGYAAAFDNIDDGGDIIRQGAFERTIKENFDRIKVCLQHGEGIALPIGKPLELREDDNGLYIKAKIVDTNDGRDAKVLIKEGILTEMSIGYDPIEFKENSDGTREIFDVELWEFSPVTWAMNNQALITGYKSKVKKRESPTTYIKSLNQAERSALFYALKKEQDQERKHRINAARKAARLYKTR